MTVKDKVQRAAAAAVLSRLIKYVRKDPDTNLVKLVDRSERFVGNIFPAKNFDSFREGAKDPENVWRQLALKLIDEIDDNVLMNMMLALGLGAGVNGTKTVRANREKYHCNIPWVILLDPTSACNRKCKGCWSAEYGHKQSLTFDELNSIVNQGVAMGTHFYMFTGGEPLLRKKDLIKLCELHPDCAFLSYTNADLVDEEFCEEMKRVGNISLAISIEGTKDSNDARRGEGSYDHVMKAMDLLKSKGCLFGISVCYTRANVDAVTSDEFVDLMISRAFASLGISTICPSVLPRLRSLSPRPSSARICTAGCAKCATARPESPCSSSTSRTTRNMSADASRAAGTISISTLQAISSPACSYTTRTPTSANRHSSRRSSVLSSRHIGTVSRSTTTICARARCLKTRSA
ncbi:MAG: radical SAM protein [Acutalibacteraceae bacterium]